MNDELLGVVDRELERGMERVVEIEGVVGVAQGKPHTCGPAMLESLLRTRDMVDEAQVVEESLIEQLGCNAVEGTMPQRILEKLGELGLEVEISGEMIDESGVSDEFEISESREKWLVDKINEGKGVMVIWQAWLETGRHPEELEDGHWSTVVGYKLDERGKVSEYKMADPGVQKVPEEGPELGIRWIKAEEFYWRDKGLWEEDGNRKRVVFDQWGAAVSLRKGV